MSDSVTVKIEPEELSPTPIPLPVDEEEQNGLNEALEGKAYTANNSVRKFFIAHKGIDWKNMVALCLPHPQTKVDSLFLINFAPEPMGTNLVFEVLTMAQERGSWFVGNSVVSDGRMNVCTPMDPLFLLIPPLAKVSRSCHFGLLTGTKAMPLLDCLMEVYTAKIANALVKAVPAEQLEHISVKKECGDIMAYIYSEEATLSWLMKKTKVTADFLKKKGLTSSEASVSLNFASSSASKSETDYLRYGCEIVCNYVDDSLKKKLMTKLGLPTESERAKRKMPEAEDEDGRKKMKGNEDGTVKPLEDYGSSKPSVKVTANVSSAKQKELKKAAQGTHTLFKFFKPKPKPG